MNLGFERYIIEKIKYIRSRFDEKITPLVAFRYKDGVLILAKNTIELYRKTGELWEGIIYGMIGEHKDIELMVTKLASACNAVATYLDKKDIHLNWIATQAANFISWYLENTKGLIVRVVVADKNSIILIDETGRILSVEHFPCQSFIVLAGKDEERRKIEEFLKQKLNLSWKDLNFEDALKVAKEALDLNPYKVFYELVVIKGTEVKIYNYNETLEIFKK